MTDKIDLKVGETIFHYDEKTKKNIELLVVEKTDGPYTIQYCKSCFFQLKNCSKYYCLSKTRKDKKNVVFINKKDNIKYDNGKLRFDLVDPYIEKALAEVYTFGQQKGYKEQSWRDVEIERYLAALKRHLNEWQSGNKTDQESNLNHLKHVLWNAGAMLWIDEIKNQKDK